MTAPVVSVGELRPVALAGGDLPPVVAAAVDDTGAVVVSTGDTIVRIEPDGTSSVLVEAGDFVAVPELDVCETAVLFRAILADGREGMYLCGLDGSLRRLARSGAEYTAFAQPTIVAAGEGHSLAFVAVRADGRASIVQHPAYEPPSVSLTADTVSISPLGAGLCCVSPQGALIVTTSVVSTGDWLRPGGDFPGLGRIARLHTPPAVCAQLGFVTVDLAAGGQALCTRPPAIESPTVLLRTGDAVPGFEARVATVGVPVASTSPALQSPYGVVAPITLDDGTAALWAGVFAGQAPMDGTAFIPWVAGEAGVQRLRPVQLSCTGTLLAYGEDRLYTLSTLL